MPKSKRTIILGIMILILLVLLTQFGSGLKQFMNQPRPDEDEGEYNEPVFAIDKAGLALKIDVSLPQDVFKELMRVSGQFERQYGIAVELRNKTEHEISEGLKQSLALQQSADIIMIRSERVKSYAQTGKLLPQQPSVETWAYAPEWLKEAVSWNGFVWGTPYYMDPYVLVWNPVALKAQTGIEKPPFSLKEWHAAMRGPQQVMFGQMQPVRPLLSSTLTMTEQSEKDGKKQIALAWFAWEEQDPYALLALMWRLGMIQMSDDSNVNQNDSSDPVVPTLPHNQLATYPWQENLKEWEHSRLLFKSVSFKNEKSIWEMINQGEVQFAIVPYSEAAPRLGEMLAVEMPRDIVPPYGTWVKSMSYIVPAYTELEEEAKLWIQFVTDVKQQQHVLANLSFLLPTSRTSQDKTWELWNRNLPAVYIQADTRLKEVLRHTFELEKWHNNVLEWMKGTVSTDILVKEFKALWKLTSAS
ncbi:ABC transporter substrate-binding protein [Paenibacillus arenosi]|uniref:Carbohydrate ABC transporter substrate-binding protein n=1 Tax=Paenibacillus arenosi TaxID=2774142 RepID=A0ABR9AUX2_9BACL|nr:ABC transporter substrate-binding protein [Paenibacillus arenosi]MBD8496746.1 carbohydrate ABC transporter substrate-binding protein [Paenibacillus arenosi]